MSKALNVIDKFEDLVEQGFSGSGSCRCPRCGHNQPHLPGQPCRLKNCPKCKIPMTRTIKAGEGLEEGETIAVIYKKGIPVAVVNNMNVMSWFSGHNLNVYSAMSSGEYEVKDVSSEEGMKIMKQLKGQ